jgi:type IV pilus biogenesis protein CpaD/CtpE
MRYRGSTVTSSHLQGSEGPASAKAIAQRIKDKLRMFGMDDAVIRGEGYEALVTRDGIVVGRVYIGTIEEVEGA